MSKVVELGNDLLAVAGIPEIREHYFVTYKKE